MNKHIVFGIMAHVDAGKTTLSEGFLFASGKLKKRGRVDKGDTCLDNVSLERERGITIFSKQAEFSAFEKDFTLLDTPGHVDFHAEMERVLSVLDYGILVISGTEGIRPHTLTVWKLLEQYEIPVFIFVNKMDSSIKKKEEWLEELKRGLHTGVACIPGELSLTAENEADLENLAVLDEEMMEAFLENGEIQKKDLINLIKRRRLFPCYFGSALKYEGVEDFLKAFADYTESPVYGEDFAARVFKISRDASGNRQTHLKILGGSLAVRDRIGEEKINQIRFYAGDKYEIRERAEAGEVCAVTGLSEVFAGEGLGALKGDFERKKPAGVINYSVLLPEGVDALGFLPKLRELGEEIPELDVTYHEKERLITVVLIGEVQKEILVHIIKEKYDILLGFGEGNIVYKESIRQEVTGFGHFEPLKHYAEVHLRLVPAKRGSGISFYSEVGEDELAINHQKQILNALKEKEHIGVLTGSSLTDVEIRLVKGRAHLKHTDGGDFREAGNRAVRNALMRGESILLEPIYDFVLELPEAFLGRALSDLSAKNASFTAPEIEGGLASISGKVPVASLSGYETVLRAYTKGEGRLSVLLSGYEDCHNAAEVIEKRGYYPEADTENTADSVFCSHGAGFVVPWYEVEAYMHLSIEKEEEKDEADEISFLRYAEEMERQTGKRVEEAFIGHEEIDKLLGQAVNSNKKKEAEGIRNRWKKKKVPYSGETEGRKREYKPINTKNDFLLVDGYNIIFAWEELKRLANVNIDSARDKLIELMMNYQGYKGNRLILVFDAYKVRGGHENHIKAGGIDIIYTREAETADQYIARTSSELTKEGRVSVATSDSLVQMIIFGSGAIRLSASDLLAEVEYVAGKIRETIS